MNLKSDAIAVLNALGMKCAVFGCWDYTGHRSGLCRAHRKSADAGASPALRRGFVLPRAEHQAARDFANAVAEAEG